MAGGASPSCIFCQIARSSTSTTLLHSVRFSLSLSESESSCKAKLFLIQDQIVQDEKVVAFPDKKPSAFRYQSTPFFFSSALTSYQLVMFCVQHYLFSLFIGFHIWMFGTQVLQMITYHDEIVLRLNALFVFDWFCCMKLEILWLALDSKFGFANLNVGQDGSGLNEEWLGSGKQLLPSMCLILNVSFTNY